MANKIVFKLGETKIPGGVEQCVSLIAATTKVRFTENDHVMLLADDANQSVVTLLFDDANSKNLFDSPPPKVNLLPRTVAAAGISPAPVDKFKLAIRKDLDGAARKYSFRTEPPARCSDQEATDVIVEC